MERILRESIDYRTVRDSITQTDYAIFSVDERVEAGIWKNILLFFLRHLELKTKLPYKRFQDAVVEIYYLRDPPYTPLGQAFVGCIDRFMQYCFHLTNGINVYEQNPLQALQVSTWKFETMKKEVGLAIDKFVAGFFVDDPDLYSDQS